MAGKKNRQVVVTETGVGNPKVVAPIDPVAVQEAIKRLIAHKLHERMCQVSGNESHYILPEIWPVIKELCLIADACQAGMIEVKERGD